MSEDLEKLITALEEAKTLFSDCRSDALLVAAREIDTVEPSTTSVQSAEMFDRLVAIADRAIAAEMANRSPSFMVV